MDLNKVFITTFLSLFLGLIGCQQDGSGDRSGRNPTPETESSGTGMKSTQGSEYTGTGSVADPTRAGGEAASSTGGRERAGAGPDTSATTGPAGGTGMGSGSTNAGETGSGLEKAEDYMDDSLITAKIKQDIVSDPLLKASQIEVETQNGVVKLSGAVDSQQSVDRVKAIAQSVTDVKAVESDLVIKEGVK